MSDAATEASFSHTFSCVCVGGGAYLLLFVLPVVCEWPSFKRPSNFHVSS
jgi:hypothetical protein